MDRLLAVNETMAVYYHDESTPAKKVDPFKYLNELLSIRSARGLVSFLQQYPDELVILREAAAFKNEKEGGYVVGRLRFKELKHVRPKRGLSYGRDERQKEDKEAQQGDASEEEIDLSSYISRFDFGSNAIMNAAAEFNIDYLDALTDLEKYAHYDETFETWAASLPTVDEPWTPEVTRSFYETIRSRPKADLRVVFLPELEIRVIQIEAILELACVSRGTLGCGDMFKFEHVNGPMGLCRAVFPEHYVSDLLPIEEALYALDNLHTDYYSHVPTRLHLEDEGGISFLAHTSDEALAVQDAAGCIISFVLAEWSHYYNKTDTMSYDVNFGYRLYEQKNNEVVTELCRIVAEGRIGICPVCERPFVVKRRPVDGVINKKFCTNSCKVKGFAERRNEEQGQ